MLDLEPAAGEMARLLQNVRPDQLTASTPCEKYSLGDLIDHVGRLALAFTEAADKTYEPGGTVAPSGDASRLEPGWCGRIQAQLAELGRAWRQPSAWEGLTEIGTLEVPAPIAGNVALGELIIHGWDVARSTGRPYELDPGLLEAYLKFGLQAFDPNKRTGPGPFGPAVDVPPHAPVLDRVIAFSGRDPGWAPDVT